MSLRIIVSGPVVAARCRFCIFVFCLLFGIGGRGLRAADYDAAFVRAKQILEESLGDRMEVRLRLASGQESDLVGRRQMPAHVVAFYDRPQNDLVVDPDRCRASLFGETQNSKEVEDAILVLMLHELLHVYQTNEIEKGSPRPVEGRWLRFLCEGHAVEFSWRLARENGVSARYLERLNRPGTAKSHRRDFGTSRAQLLHHLLYELSREYVAAHCDELGDFEKLLGKAPTYAEVISGATTPTPTASTAPSRMLDSLRVRECSVEKALELDYLDAMALISPGDFSRQQIVASYQGGAFTQVYNNSNYVDLAVFQFDTGAAAKEAGSLSEKYYAAPQRAKPAKDGSTPQRNSQTTPSFSHAERERKILVKQNGGLLTILFFVDTVASKDLARKCLAGIH